MNSAIRAAAIGCFLMIISSSVMALDNGSNDKKRDEMISRLSGVVQSVMSGDNWTDTGQVPVVRRGSSGCLGSFPNIKVNQDFTGLSQNETSITVNPLDFNNLVGGWNDYRYSETEDVKQGYGYSFDGGLTWGDGVLTGFPTYEAQGDPAVAFDRTGKVFFALIAFDRGYGDNGVFVCVSNDGGQNWGSPVPINTSGSNEFNDKPYIAVDITKSPYANNIYVTWTLFDWLYGGNPILLSRSTNGGVSFSSPVQVSSADYAQGSIPVIGPDGEVYVAWFNYSTGNRLSMNASNDGGLNFGPDRTIQNITPLPGYLNPGFRVNSFPIMAADISNGPMRSNLYACWGDYRNGDADIYFSRSTDEGVNWSSAIRVNDDTISNGRDQWFPWLSVDANGNVVVIFMDRRNDSSNLYFDIYMARSIDGGLTFEDNVLVTTTSSDPRTDFEGTFLGDYNGCVSTFDYSYPLWTDTRNGDQDAYTAIIPTGPDNDIVDVVLSPDASTVPQGGTLIVDLLITNLTGSPQPFDPLVEVRLPNATMIVYSDPEERTIPGDGILSKTFSLPVPASAPLGSYMLKITLYNVITGGSLAMDYFPFEIVP
jgi:hypothetical protein